MNEIPFTAAAYLTRDPELRFTQTGQPVANLGLAVTPRRYNAAEKTWADGETMFFNAAVWGPQAENTAQSLSRGSRVVIIGTVVARKYTPQQGPNAGVEQTRFEVIVDEIGPSLRWAEATVRKVERSKTTENAPQAVLPGHFVQQLAQRLGRE